MDRHDSNPFKARHLQNGWGSLRVNMAVEALGTATTYQCHRSWKWKFGNREHLRGDFKATTAAKSARNDQLW